MNIILLLISLVLFFFAPQNYSFLFCVMCFIVFAIGAYYTLRKDSKRMGLLSFNLFFLLSFYLCSYAFPVFMYPAGFSGIIGLMANESSINVCAAMCTVAISGYFVGYHYKFEKKCGVVLQEFQPTYSARTSAYLLFYFFLAIISGVLFVFLRTEHVVAIEVTDMPYAFILFEICLAILLIINSYFSNKKSYYKFYSANRTPLIASCAIMFVFLIIGDRKPIMEIGLVVLTVLSLFYKGIKSRHLVIMIISAAVLMAMVGVTRTSSNSSLRDGGFSSFVKANEEVVKDESTTMWSYFSDLTERYEELYQGYEYVQTYKNQYPLRIFPLLFSPIPLAPNIVSYAIYNRPLSETAPGAIVGKFWDVHAGTHCVVDIYMPWGIAGVILCFLVFGYIISCVTRQFDVNIYAKVFYVILVSQSIFMPRGSLFDIYRPLVWAAIIIYFLRRK